MCTPQLALFAVQASRQISATKGKHRALEASAKSAQETARRQQEALTRRTMQQERKAEADIGEMMRRVDVARSRTLQAGVEAGASGTSMQEALMAVEAEGGRAETGIRQQFGYTAQELAERGKDVNLQLGQRLQLLHSQRTTGGQAAMGLAGSALQAYQMFAPEGSNFFESFGLKLPGGTASGATSPNTGMGYIF